MLIRNPKIIDAILNCFANSSEIEITRLYDLDQIIENVRDEYKDYIYTQEDVDYMLADQRSDYYD